MKRTRIHYYEYRGRATVTAIMNAATNLELRQAFGTVAYGLYKQSDYRYYLQNDPFKTEPSKVIVIGPTGLSSIQVGTSYLMYEFLTTLGYMRLAGEYLGEVRDAAKTIKLNTAII
jgi:hypothetical protein